MGTEKFYIKKGGKKTSVSISWNLFDILTESFDCSLYCIGADGKYIHHLGVKAKMRKIVYFLISEEKNKHIEYFGNCFDSNRLERIVLNQIHENLTEGFDRERFDLDSGGDFYELEIR
jgi:hypothetical protein